VVNRDQTLDVLFIEGAAGKKIRLSAAGSSDPDGNTLRCGWVYYPEPGTYGGKISLSAETGKTTSFTVPSDFARGDSIHVILIVTDNGAPALTRYRRVVVHGR
jgi:hypothetical protein